MRQPVAALRPALTAYDPGAAQLREDVLQERQRDALGLGDLVDLAGSVGTAAGELDGGSHGVIGLRSRAHTGDSLRKRGARLHRWLGAPPEERLYGRGSRHIAHIDGPRGRRSSSAT